MSSVNSEVKESVQPETTYTIEQVQRAKDFIWDKLASHTKEIMMMEATTDLFLNEGLICKEIKLVSSYI